MTTKRNSKIIQLPVRVAKKVKENRIHRDAQKENKATPCDAFLERGERLKELIHSTKNRSSNGRLEKLDQMGPLLEALMQSQERSRENAVTSDGLLKQKQLIVQLLSSL